MVDRRVGQGAVAFVLAVLQAAVAGADALRCGARIVSRGDSAHQVASICGDPVDVVPRVEYRTLRRGPVTGCVESVDGQHCAAQAEETREVVIEEWTYDLGANKLVKRLTFEDGVLTRIRSVR